MQMSHSECISFNTAVVEVVVAVVVIATIVKIVNITTVANLTVMTITAKMELVWATKNNDDPKNNYTLIIEKVKYFYIKY